MSRRLSLVITVVVLLALFVPVSYAAPEFPVTAPHPLSAVQEDELQIYIIQLNDAPLAAYRGGLRDLVATSPEVTGARKLDVTSSASRAYGGFLAEKRAEFLQRAAEQLGRTPEVGYIYDVVLNGLTLKLTPAEAARVAALPGVKQVEPRQVRQLLTDRGPTWIGAPAIWGALGSCAAGGKCGEGVVVGIVDTGINMDHPSFQDPAPTAPAGDGYNHTNPRGHFYGWCNPSHANYDPTLPCNDKLIGVYSYTNSGMNPEDAEGHGSHTASTAAGNRLTGVLLDAPTVDLAFSISGVAPHANIIAYDACQDGCDSDDLLAAINQAATDQVDVINYSISGSGGSPWDAADEMAFLNARKAGVFVAASAGNAGPGAGTVAHGSPWLTTVAASTHDRALVNALVDLTGGSYALADITGRSLTAGLPSASLVYAGDYGNALCEASIWGANTFAGQIVVCDRGVNARVEKAQNVQAAGGAGMVLANALANGDELIGDAYAIPGVHITYADGVALKAWLDSGSGHAGAIAGTTKSLADINGDVMAAFSSRGPNKSVGDVLKPDITGPGVDILAAVASLGQTKPELDIYSGTSMSSPHLAGAGALMTQAHPTWTPAEIQSALMSTAWLAQVRKEDGITPSDPFDRGAGRVNLANAVNAGLILSVADTAYDTANPATGGDPKTLNLASMADDACYRSCSWTRTVKNPTGTTMNWTGEFVGQDGLAGTLTGATITNLAGGASASFTLTINDTAGLIPGQWYFGQVNFTETAGQAPDAHFPVAIKVAGSQDRQVVTKTAAPTGIDASTGGQVTYSITVYNAVKANASYSIVDPVPANSTYVAGSASPAPTSTNPLTWSGTLTPATFVIEERTDLSGYQSMAAEGVAPFDPPDLGTDWGYWTIQGLDFYYLGVHYTEAVWCADGLIIAGAGPTAIKKCGTGANQNLPSSTDPDNVIAPWWDDLDLSGGNWYAVGLNWNGAPHTVFEWENVLIKGASTRITFQIWIEEGTGNIWFAYPSGFNPGTSPSATVGAENATGSEGVKYYYRGATGGATGKIPDGTKDLWVGLKPSSTTVTFKVNATGAAGSNILNEATATVGSFTNKKAYANTRICGAATAVQPGIAIQALDYTLTAWAGSPYDSYELWRSTTPYFTPGISGTQVYAGKAFSTVDAATGPTVGDPVTNYYYVLRTANCAGASVADSSAVGEFDFALMPGQ